MDDNDEDYECDEASIPDEEFALYHRGFKRLWEGASSRAVKWLYENYIPRGSFVVLVGESGIGKSTLAMDLSVAVANAAAFAGYDYASSELDLGAILEESTTHKVKPSFVLYLYGEGGASQAARFVAAHETQKRESQHLYGEVADDPEKLPIFRKELMSVSEGHNSLRAHIDRMKAAKDYQDIRKVTQLQYGLIVVDTLIAVGGIGAENESGSMQNCINSLKELAREFNATVIVIVHPKKGSNEIRGSSALYNAADVVLRIERKPHSADILRLVHEKARHGPKQQPKNFRLVPFAGDPSIVGGGTVPPVIEWLDEDESKKLSSPRRVQREQSASADHDGDSSGYDVYMEAAKIAVMGHGVPDAVGFIWTTLDALRGEFARMYQRNAEANRKAFERAHKRAVAEGKMMVSTVGHGQHLFRIVE